MLAWVYRALFAKTDVRVLMVGLDAAGKTTVLYKLKLGEIVTTIPTIGFNVETIDYPPNVSVTVWDVGGRSMRHELYRHYYANMHAAIFCVDCSDRDRLPEAKDHLSRMLSADELRDCVFLIFANKQDVPNAMTKTEVTAGLGLSSVQNRTWFVQPACATTGEGLHEGLDWLCTAIAVKRGDAHAAKQGVVAPPTADADAAGDADANATDNADADANADRGFFSKLWCFAL